MFMRFANRKAGRGRGDGRTVARCLHLAPRLAACTIIAAASLIASGARPEAVTAVRFWSQGDATRVAVEVTGPFDFKYDHLDNPYRVFFDIPGAHPDLGRKGMNVIRVNDRLVRQIRVAETQRGVTRVVLDLTEQATVTTSKLENPDRLIIEVSAVEARRSKTSTVEPGRRDGSRDGLSAAARDAERQTAPRESERKADLTDQAASRKSAGRESQIIPVEEKSTAIRQDAPAALAETAPAPRVFQPPYMPKGPRERWRFEPVVLDPPPLERASAWQTTIMPNDPLALMSMQPLRVPGPPMVMAKVTRPAPLAVGAPVLVAERVVATPRETLPRESTVRATPPDAGRIGLPAKTPAARDESMIRALGLKVGRIVIDAGHGGHDTGSIGPGGLLEKDLVLDVALRLGALIQQRLGYEVIYTRTDDTFIPLEERTAIANEKHADLFLSIHANSSMYKTVAGVETYYLNFTTSKAALDVAARENATSNKTVFELRDLLQKIALKDKVDESREFALRIQNAMYAMSAKSSSRARDRGVRKAPFVVLIGASMPSVLAEIGFISNPHDEAMMRRSEYRQKIAEALFKGVGSYAATLSHYQVAETRGR